MPPPSNRRPQQMAVVGAAQCCQSWTWTPGSSSVQILSANFVIAPRQWRHRPAGSGAKVCHMILRRVPVFCVCSWGAETEPTSEEGRRFERWRPCGFFAASKVQVTLRDLGIQSEAGLPEYSWTVGEFLLSSNVCLRLGKRNLRSQRPQK